MARLKQVRNELIFDWPKVSAHHNAFVSWSVIVHNWQVGALIWKGWHPSAFEFSRLVFTVSNYKISTKTFNTLTVHEYLSLFIRTVKSYMSNEKNLKQMFQVKSIKMSTITNNLRHIEKKASIFIFHPLRAAGNYHGAYRYSWLTQIFRIYIYRVFIKCGSLYTVATKYWAQKLPF